MSPYHLYERAAVKLNGTLCMKNRLKVAYALINLCRKPASQEEASSLKPGGVAASWLRLHCWGETGGAT